MDFIENYFERMLFSGGLAITGALLGMILFVAILIVIEWKIFEKGGEAGWKCLIPFYAGYTEYKICWVGSYYWIRLGLIVGSTILSLIPLIGPAVSIAAWFAVLVISTVKDIQKAKAFGQDMGFAVGLILVGIVFEILLAFDKNIKYAGVQPSPSFFNDGIVGSIGRSSGSGYRDYGAAPRWDSASPSGYSGGRSTGGAAPYGGSSAPYGGGMYGTGKPGGSTPYGGGAYGAGRPTGGSSPYGGGGSPYGGGSTPYGGSAPYGGGYGDDSVTEPLSYGHRSSAPTTPPAGGHGAPSATPPGGRLKGTGLKK